MDNNNNNDNNNDQDINGAGNGVGGAFTYLYSAGHHEMLVVFPTDGDVFERWTAGVDYLKTYISDCNELIRWEDGRPAAYERWLTLVIDFAAVWGVSMVPPDIVESYNNVRAGVAGVDGIRAYGALAEEVAAR